MAGVLKADAYGLGAGRVGPALWAEGCRRFFVAHLAEAVRLRAALPGADIAVLYGLPAGTEGDFLAHGVAPVLNRLDEIGRWRDLARRTGCRLPALIHIDTGLNRLGLEPAEVDRLAADPAAWLDGLDLRLWLTHLACPDIIGHPLTAAQAAAFARALARLPAAPASISSSSALFQPPAHRPEALARSGAALYGVNPTPDAPNPMRPVVRLQARVLQVRSVDTPMTVGYGATHQIRRRGRIATVSVGYADGYMRSLSARGHVAAGPLLAPVIGRISMDLLTVDVTDWPETAPRPGDLVDLIGPHRGVDDVAAEAGTIGYEILTALGPRHHRVYLGVGAPAPATAPPRPLEASWAF